MHLSTLKKFAGQTAIYGLSTIVSRVLNFFLTPIYVRVYPPSVYGIFTTMYAWASLLNALMAFGMETTFFRYLNKHEHSKQDVYNNTFIGVLSIAFVFLISALFLIDDVALWMQKGSATKASDYASYIKYFIFILIADALAVIPFAKIRAEGRPLRYSFIKFVNIISFISFNLIFLFGIPLIIANDYPGSDFLQGWYRNQWIGYVFISNLIASLLTLLLLLPELLQFRLKLDGKLMKNMFYYSFPILIANFSFIINEHIDKIFLKQLLPGDIGVQEAGIYGACSKIAVFLSIFINAFRLGAEPFFFSQAKNKNSSQTYARILTYFVIAVSVIFVALTVNIELLKYFVKGGNPTETAMYWSGLKVVPILLLGYVSLGIYMNLSIWYKLSDQTKYGLYISGAGAIVTIVLNLIFIPKYSYIAAAWVSLIAYSTMMILSYILGQRNYPIPYNLKKNITYLVLAIVVAFLSFNIFDRSLIIGNILLLLFVLIILYFERKELKLLFGVK